jgi:hypothetical protein
MKRLLTAVLMIAAAGFAGACANEDERGDVLGVPLPGANVLDVRIAGPVVLREDGQYRWTAVLNDAEIGDAEYAWNIFWPDATALHQSFDGPAIDLTIDADRQLTFELYLTVRAGERIGAANALVTICPLSPPDPVDDCGSVVLLKSRR